MRRRISLYIADKLADLDKDSLVLLNYTFEELSNPTIVKNSYSQQLSLKGTSANNRIFGEIFRYDHTVTASNAGVGNDFNPSIKTPFTIYNEMNEILESGYIKLDSISRNGADITYNVTLYGGLGSFLYGLSYDEDGNKRTLAGLDYLGTDDPDSELDFIINKDAVKSAWTRIKTNPSSISQIWDVLNFAPAYNGIPSSNFNANKAIINAESAGLQGTGNVLVSLAQSYNEWATKDLRSYLQRPVLSFRAFMEAMGKPSNNGGYTLDLDTDFFNNSNPYYRNAWLTLPLINSLMAATDELRIRKTYADTGVTSDYTYELDIDNVPLGTDVEAKVEISLSSNHDGWFGFINDTDGRRCLNAALVQIYAVDGNGTLVDASDILSFQTDVDGYSFSTNDIIALGEYTPAYITQPGQTSVGGFVGGEWNGGKFVVTLRGTNIEGIRARVTFVNFLNDFQDTALPNYLFTQDVQNVSTVADSDKNTSTFKAAGGADFTYKVSSTARSGAKMTKRLLLNSQNSPADYLISYCKMFGLQMRCDKATKTITIRQRKALFEDTVMDISSRIDLSKGLSDKPYLFDAKWYEFNTVHKGEFVDYYNGIYNRNYGTQRINTGTDFNADTKEILSGIAFNGAADVLERSPYFVSIEDGGNTIPAVFLDQGHKYKVGDTEYDVPVVGTGASVSYMNASFNSYDVIRKPQFHNADDKSFDERDTLLFFQGTDASGAYSGFALTDDDASMATLNNNVPCWILNPDYNNSGYAVSGIYPVFVRDWVASGKIVKSWEIGQPFELAVPGVATDIEAYIYTQYWQKFIADQYDVNTRVLTCKVDLSGLQVNENLFGKFYFFENSLWVLNKIINYSLTTYDMVECEFIKVQDKNNYLTY